MYKHEKKIINKRILLIYEEERMIRDTIRDTILISMEQIIPLIKGSLLDFSP